MLPELLEEGLAADLVYLDLGISSMQVDARERGFSYSYDAPLDMRMDPSRELDARTVVNEWPEARLVSIFRQYGEERYARGIAREIVRRRRKAPIETTTDLVDAIKRAVPTPAQFAGGHPRAACSRRSGSRSTTSSSRSSARCPRPGSCCPGGRMAAISFHSLEDRMVKRFFADRARGCICPPDLPVCGCGREPEAELINRRAVRPSEGEVAGNPRASPAGCARR